MTVSVSISLRTQDANKPRQTVAGTSPSANCPLAVTPIYLFSPESETWFRADGWCVTHRPTGLRLPTDFASEGEAMAALRRALPDFPGWLMARGVSECAATVACRAMWRVARAV